jgi:CBS domain-containing protein
MLVKQLMTRNVSSCRPENNLAELAELMWNHRCGVLPILDGAGRMTGIITDRDICIALGTRNLRASEVLAQDVSRPTYFSCSPDNDVRDALKTMASQEVSRLPVVDETGRLVGILSIDDIVFRAGGGRSSLSDHEIVDALIAMWADRVHHPEEAGQNESELTSDLRMPMNYQHSTRPH